MIVTLTDVAQAAGVSLATASRAFKQPERLAPATRDKVLRTAEELGYLTTSRPTGQNFTLIVPDAASPVFASLVAAVLENAWHGHHRILLESTAEHPEREAEILRSLGSDVGGVLLVSPRLGADDIQRFAGDVPVVVVNGAVEFCPSVLLAADAGIRQAFEHLLALGHRRFAYAPGPATSWANGHRQQAALDAVAAVEGAELVVLGHQSATVEGGLAPAASVVASGATAVLAYNDLVALGIRSGARSLGVSCPTDLSIVGIDDLNIAAVSEPQLSTVRVDIARGGTRAFRLLTELAAGRGVSHVPDSRASQFIPRESTTTVTIERGGARRAS